MNVYLVGSSLLFTVPMSLAVYVHAWDIWLSLFFLTWTSVIYHSTQNQLFVYVDFTAVYNLVGQTLRYGYATDRVWIPVTTVTLDGILYYWGRMTNTFAFHTNPKIATLSHMAIHLISATGTTLLLLNRDVVDGRNLTHRLEG